MKTIEQLIAMATDSNVHHKTLSAAAKEVLGDDCPTTRDEILTALKAAKSVNDDVQREHAKSDMREVFMLRKYAPKSVYQVFEGDDWNEYNQPVATDATPEIIYMTVAPGRLTKLPKDEAARAIKLGIAQMTENTMA